MDMTMMRKELKEEKKFRLYLMRISEGTGVPIIADFRIVELMKDNSIVTYIMNPTEKIQ